MSEWVNFLEMIRKREKQALNSYKASVDRQKASQHYAEAGVLLELAEQVADKIDPNWRDEDSEKGPFCLLERDIHPTTDKINRFGL